jgi:hypothetical protein
LAISLKFLKARTDDVTNGDKTHETAGLNYWEMAHSLSRHKAHECGTGGVKGAGDDVPRHQGKYLILKRFGPTGA